MSILVYRGCFRAITSSRRQPRISFLWKGHNEKLAQLILRKNCYMKIKNKVYFLWFLRFLWWCYSHRVLKNQKKTTIEFQFIVDGESYSNLTVSNTKEFTYPTNPEKEGYIFDNWYLNSNYTQVFDLSVIENKITKGKVVLYGNFKTCDHEWGSENCSVCGATAGLEYEKRTNGYH